MAELRVILCDNHLPVVEAWQAYFAGVPGVDITCDEIFAVEADGLVSPANSFGRMDGGLDAQIIEFLGEDVETEVQRVIRERHDGELIVGGAEVILTLAPQFPYLVVAPTMRVPQNVSRTVNAYLAFRAALRAVRAFNALHGGPIGTLLVPGLAPSNGFLPPLRGGGGPPGGPHGHTARPGPRQVQGLLPPPARRPPDGGGLRHGDAGPVPQPGHLPGRRGRQRRQVGRPRRRGTAALTPSVQEWDALKGGKQKSREAATAS